MQVTASLGVDAGNICALDVDYIRENGGIPNSRGDLGVAVPVTPGWYRVTLSVDESYRDVKSVTQDMQIKGSLLMIGDACYHWTETQYDEWSNFLSKTEVDPHKGGLEKFEDSRGMCLDTGGDGSFVVTCSLQPL